MKGPLCAALLTVLSVIHGQAIFAQAPVARSVDINQAYLLLSWAAHLTGYALPSRLPNIRFESPEWFKENVCGDRDTCTTLGIHDSREGIVLISTLEGSPLELILFHELVHYLQIESGYYANTCESLRVREQEAYAIQNKFALLVLGAAEHYYENPPINCSGTGPVRQ